MHENTIIDWGHIISSEVSFQLNNLKKTRKFYMSSYVFFTIAYCHVFEDLSRERIIDFKMDLVYAGYSTFWRHKSQCNFYLVHNNFISEFKKLVFGQVR
jgi:hypothetical protein